MIAKVEHQVNRLPVESRRVTSVSRHRCDDLPPANIADCTADEYLYWCEVAIRRGAPIPQWQTPEQYLAGLDSFPDRVRLASPEVHSAMGLPANYGRVTAFPVEWQERFLCTLATDAEFADAVRGLLLGGRQ